MADVALLVGDGQALAALGATTGENLTAVLRGHAGKEAVALGTLPLIGLVRTLHGDPPGVARLCCVCRQKSL